MNWGGIIAGALAKAVTGKEHPEVAARIERERGDRRGAGGFGAEIGEGFGILQEGLVVGGVIATLGDQVVQELGHLLVELWVGELVALQGDADVVDDALGDRVLGQLALGVKLLGDGIVHAGLDDELGEGEVT